MHHRADVAISCTSILDQQHKYNWDKDWSPGKAMLTELHTGEDKIILFLSAATGNFCLKSTVFRGSTFQRLAHSQLCLNTTIIDF